MTATLQHATWCTDHVDDSPELDKGYCRLATITHGVEVEIASDIDTLQGAPGIEIYAPGQTYLTAAQVRDVAGQMLRAASTLDGRPDMSIDVNLIGRAAEHLGVAAAELVRALGYDD